MHKSLIALAAATALAVSPALAFAQDQGGSTPSLPKGGGAAGSVAAATSAAQGVFGFNPLLFLLGIGVVAGGIALAASGGNNSNNTSSATASTP
jgi:hypothetical protein